ncbi:hypothetical protein Bca4012_099790 [Brassica carinata]|uniref:Uncharacterized protein n=2 Tax=Brassica TaxID=3705 RepID=A0A3P6GRR9_BRAOL|nr:unnamed protein product [Brassica napus]CDY57241.1 BnaCnng31710D [Brassica napus]VDD62211.1 unnamed protein product [Brassica oleracea]
MYVTSRGCIYGSPSTHLISNDQAFTSVYADGRQRGTRRLRFARRLSPWRVYHHRHEAKTTSNHKAWSPVIFINSSMARLLRVVNVDQDDVQTTK